MRKKLLSLVLALTMMLSMGTVAMADEPDYVTTVDLAKLYKLVNTTGVKNPAEDFVFEITKHSVSDSLYTIDDMPMFEDGDTSTTDVIDYKISYSKGETTTIDGDRNTVTLTLPKYEHVGIFTYKIVEKEGTTAGVTYDSNPLYLKVTVVEDDGKKKVVALRYENAETGTKETDITNTYSAGTLEISKTVTGNLGEKDRYFDVTVTLNAPTGKNVNSVITINNSELSYNNNPTSIVVGTSTIFKLKDGETLKLGNIPYDVTYSVIEADYTKNPDNYDKAVYTGSDYSEDRDYTDIKLTGEDTSIKGTNTAPSNFVMDSETETVGIQNHKNQTVDTGINLDSMPYILILAAVAVGGVAIISKKRREEF